LYKTGRKKCEVPLNSLFTLASNEEVKQLQQIIITTDVFVQNNTGNVLM